MSAIRSLIALILISLVVCVDVGCKKQEDKKEGGGTDKTGGAEKKETQPKKPSQSMPD